MGAADPADAVFSALSDGTRRNLFALLGRAGEASATDLARELPVSRQAVQKHLGALAEVGASWDDRLAALERQLSRERTARA